MHKLKFSKNWNGKLNSRMFTTIRKYEEFNAERFKVGNQLEIMYKNEVVAIGEVVDCIDVRFGLIPRYLRQLDTGYLLHEANIVFESLLGTTLPTLDAKKVFFVLVKIVKRVKYVPYDND